MAKLSREERETIAETRILRALGTLTIANQRTLEQKISDAGPYNQRVDPHILTDVRNRLGGDFSGRFRDLDAHDDGTMYKKEEPQQHIGTRSLKGDVRLDFILRTPDAGPLGLECKNVRHWMYPHVEEITETLDKCLSLDAIPVLIARRIHFATFTVFKMRCYIPPNIQSAIPECFRRAGR